MRLPTWQLRQLSRADEGQVLVLASLGLAILMLMAGLGVDVAFLRYQKQQMQRAADAGAIAGASALIYSGKWRAAAQNDASSNGFANGIKGITVTVNSPPLSGPNQGQEGYVEVVVAQPQPTFFMRVGGFTSVPVSARAVASALGNASGCLYTLAPTGSDAFDVRGNVTITSACGIFINSGDSLALDKRGNSGLVNASYVGIVGDESQSDLSNVLSEHTPDKQPVTGIARFSDPLSSVQPPRPEACTGQSGNIHGSATLTHATFCGGITINGSGTVTFNPGTYILEGGGLTVTGSPTIRGTGVTFYNTGNGTYPYAPVTIAGSASTTLSAPTDSSNGGIPGILFFQDPSIVNSSPNSINGSNGQVYTGALYFPTTSLQYRGNPSLAAYTIMVAWTLQFRGDTKIDNYTLLPGGGSPVQSAFLVE